MKMIPDECQPGLRASLRWIRFYHVFPDGIGMWSEAEQYKVVMDSFCRPEPILRTQLLNEISYGDIDLGSPSLPGLPTPEESESLSVPFQHRCRLEKIRLPFNPRLYGTLESEPPGA